MCLHGDQGIDSTKQDTCWGQEPSIPAIEKRRSAVPDTEASRKLIKANQAPGTKIQAMCLER